MIPNFKKVFKQTKKEIIQLDDEYEKMSNLNKLKSTEIRKSIDLKSSEIQKRKERRNILFNSIRNK